MGVSKIDPEGRSSSEDFRAVGGIFGVLGRPRGASRSVITQSVFDKRHRSMTDKKPSEGIPYMIRLLRALWPYPPEGGYLTIWEMPGKASIHVPIREFLQATEEDVTELLTQLEGHDIYFGHGLRRQGLTGEQRGTKKDVDFVPGFVLDVDVYNPENPQAHRAGSLSLPKTDADVDAILDGSPAPTAVVHTGNGYHFYWRFEEPQHLTCKAARDAAHKQFEAFQEPFIQRAKELGFHLDKTASIDRVWRLPGSKNHKSQITNKK